MKGDLRMVGYVNRVALCAVALAMAALFMGGCSAQGQPSSASPSSGGSTASAIARASASSEGAVSASAAVTANSAEAEAGTASSAVSSGDAPASSAPSASASPSLATTEDPASRVESDAVNLRLEIDGNPVEVAWEDNEAVAALAQHAAEASIEVQMSPHGGFEQFGPLGFDLPSEDVQTTTEPGDIVLYTGNQIVVFYGSNSWSYTRLGKVADKSADELASMLGGDAVTLTIEGVR